MPRVSFTQKEVDELLRAIVSREMELQDDFSDAETTIRAHDDYEDSEVSDEHYAEAEAELSDLETRAEILESAAKKLATVARRPCR